jgi:uncharacterized membrane protein YfcA
MDPATLALFLALGIVAGTITTFAGLGGGLVLVLALSMVGSPVEALAVTTPALLVGNLHRVAMYRRHIALRRGLRFAAGALPGALLGGFLVTVIPEWALRGLLLFSVLAAFTRKLGWFQPRVRRGALVPGGALTGIVAATTGGGGLIAGPLLLASGLEGRRFVATLALGSAAVHVGRISAYSHGGLLNMELLPGALALMLTIVIGNLFGSLLARRVSQRVAEHGTYLMFAAGLVMAIVGFFA